MNYRNTTDFFLHHKTIIVLVICAIFFMSYRGAEASILSVQTPEQISLGERITITVLIDPENIPINSVESTLVFSSEFFEYNGFSTKQSSIPIWIEKPAQKKEGEVRFSGVIPGGLERLYDPLHTNNKAIPLVQLFFIPKKEGTTVLSFANSSVLKNDGKGTATTVQTVPITLSIQTGAQKEGSSVLPEDKNPPDPFIVHIIERSFFGRTPRLAVFSTVDEEGGISHYEVAVGTLDFIKTESPFPLPYKLFPYQITVRAVDYAGNVRDQHLTIPAEGLKNTMLAVLIGAALIVLIGFLRHRFYNRSKI